MDVGFHDAPVADGFAVNLNADKEEMVMMQRKMRAVKDIKFELFKVVKKVDVKRLKHDMWSRLDRDLDRGNQGQLGELMGALYGEKVVDKENVSVQSAFICLLHLANEKSKICRAYG